MQAAGESIQHKNWQPEGGMIEITVKASKPIEAETLVTTCFRWKLETPAALEFAESPPGRVDFVNGQVKITVAVPELPSTTAADQKVARRIGLVPLAEVRILGFKKDGGQAFEAWTEIGITYWPISLLLALFVIGAAFLLLSRIAKRIPHAGIQATRSRFLRIISTPDGVASLSQFQILLWTAVVAGSAVYVGTLSGQLVEVTTGTLVLLGISGAATLAAQVTGDNAPKPAPTTNQQNPAPAPRTKTLDELENDVRLAEAALQLASTQDAGGSTEATRAALGAAQTERDKAQSALARRTRMPRWSDLLFSNPLDGGREIDVTRVQMLLFTLISAVFVSLKVLTAYVIPEIPVGYLTLMGISNGVYIGSKVVRST